MSTSRWQASSPQLPGPRLTVQYRPTDERLVPHGKGEQEEPLWSRRVIIEMDETEVSLGRLRDLYSALHKALGRRRGRLLKEDDERLLQLAEAEGLRPERPTRHDADLWQRIASQWRHETRTTVKPTTLRGRYLRLRKQLGY